MIKNRHYSTFEELYMSTRRLIMAIIIRDFTKDPQDRDEIFQVVSERMLKNADKLLSMEKAGLQSYIRKIIHSTAADHFEGKKRRERQELAMDEASGLRSDDNAVETELLLSEDIQWLDEAAKRLSPEERFMLISRFRDELSYREIAAALGISEEAARTRMHRLIMSLKRGFVKERGSKENGRY